MGIGLVGFWERPTKRVIDVTVPETMVVACKFVVSVVGGDIDEVWLQDVKDGQWSRPALHVHHVQVQLMVYVVVRMWKGTERSPHLVLL